MVKDTITKPSELLINEQPVEKLGKKVKLYKVDEFKGLNVNDIIKKVLQSKEVKNGHIQK